VYDVHMFAILNSLSVCFIVAVDIHNDICLFHLLRSICSNCNLCSLLVKLQKSV